MPELMITYRAAAFWARVYVPEMLMGFMTQEENEDIAQVEIRTENVAAEPKKVATEVLQEKTNTKPEIEEDPFNV